MTDHPNEGVGYLTWEEFERFRTAVHQSLIVVPWFRVAGHIKGQQPEVRSASSHYPLGLHPTWLARTVRIRPGMPEPALCSRGETTMTAWQIGLIISGVTATAVVVFVVAVVAFIIWGTSQMGDQD